MKTYYKIVIIITLVIATLNVSCTPRNENNSRPILKKILNREDVSSFTVPGFLVRYAMLATSETRELRSALRGVSSFTISINDNNSDSFNVFSNINSSLSSNNYFTVLEIIDSESNILIKALEVDGKIRELVMIINDSNSFVCISMQGKINPDNFSQVLETFANNKSNIIG